MSILLKLAYHQSLIVTDIVIDIVSVAGTGMETKIMKEIKLMV